jgi:hypothetical protein
MAEYNGNSIYLRMNAINVESLWKSMDIQQSIGDEDVTAGAGSVWEEHAGKLRGAKAKITLAYNDTQAATDMAALYTSNSVIAVVYGPEGNTVGKPCDSRSWLITGVSGPSTNVEKNMVVLEFELVATGTPTKNIFAGETF